MRSAGNNLEHPVGYHPWLRRSGLTLVGIAPFLLFILLLPAGGETPGLDDPDSVPAFQESVPLAFPFPQESPPVELPLTAPAEPFATEASTPEPRNPISSIKPSAQQPPAREQSRAACSMDDPARCHAPERRTEIDQPQCTDPTSPACGGPESSPKQHELPPPRDEEPEEEDQEPSGEPDPLDKGFLGDFPS